MAHRPRFPQWAHSRTTTAAAISPAARPRPSRVCCSFMFVLLGWSLEDEWYSGSAGSTTDAKCRAVSRKLAELSPFLAECCEVFGANCGTCLLACAEHEARDGLCSLGFEA